MLYWEFGQQIAVRKGMWKAHSTQGQKPMGIVTTSQDLSENRSVAHEHTELLESMKAFAQASHTPIDKGVYEDPQRTKHERDRWAKWGNSRLNSTRLQNTCFPDKWNPASGKFVRGCFQQPE